MPVQLITAAVEKAGYTLGEQIFIALDPAASEFYDAEERLYIFKKSGGAKKTAEELVDSMHFVTVSDYFRGRLHRDIRTAEEADEKTWRRRHSTGGDDLFVTMWNIRREYRRARGEFDFDKVNQIGTLTETLATINLAKRSHYTT